jgi:hypothetical protein
VYLLIINPNREISKMNKKELQALAQQAAKNIKTEKDLCEFSAMLKKITIEAALNAELDEHLGYERHQPSDNANTLNGYSRLKFVRTSRSSTSPSIWFWVSTSKEARNCWACGCPRTRVPSFS